MLKHQFNPIPHRGGGRGDSTRPQIVFFITFVRDAAEPQKVVTVFMDNLMDNKILNMKTTNFQP